MLWGVRTLFNFTPDYFDHCSLADPWINSLFSFYKAVLIDLPMGLLRFYDKMQISLSFSCFIILHVICLFLACALVFRV